jgi:hypothetical protein
VSERIWKKAALTYFKAQSKHVGEGTKKNNEILSISLCGLKTENREDGFPEYEDRRCVSGYQLWKNDAAYRSF